MKAEGEGRFGTTLAPSNFWAQRSLACEVCKATWDKAYRSLAANYEVKTAFQWLRLESTHLQRTVLSHFKLFASGGGRACDFHWDVWIPDQFRLDRQAAGAAAACAAAAGAAAAGAAAEGERPPSKRVR